MDIKNDYEMDRETPMAIDIIGGILIMVGTIYGIKKFLKDKSAINNFPANGEASLSGILIEANLNNGLAQKVRRIIKGGSLV